MTEIVIHVEEKRTWYETRLDLPSVLVALELMKYATINNIVGGGVGRPSQPDAPTSGGLRTPGLVVGKVA